MYERTLRFVYILTICEERRISYQYMLSWGSE